MKNKLLVGTLTMLALAVGKDCNAAPAFVPFGEAIDDKASI